MKVHITFPLAIYSFLFFTFKTASAQHFIFYINNHTSKNLILENNQVDHGDIGHSKVPDHIPPSDNGQYIGLFNSPYCGVEGTIKYKLQGAYDTSLILYYDNPFIGSASYSVSAITPFKYTINSWNNDQKILTIDLTEGAPKIPPVPISYSTNGVISGSIYWKKSEIDHPDIFPYYRAFTMKAYCPLQFTTNEFDNSAIKGAYNGQDGYFLGSKPVGTILYTIDNSDQEYCKLNYTASQIPVGVPVSFDIVAAYDPIKWIPGPGKPAQPDKTYTFIVSTFSTGKTAVCTLNNGYLKAEGVDFVCTGDWLKVDANGKVVGSDGFLAKIANRKNSHILPGGMLSINQVNKAIKTNQVIMKTGVTKDATVIKQGQIITPKATN
ncbi:MAG: hypothetical protein P0Y49_15285 [Candidatus Pedobacter colombiensis]|uniref:Uncharacterized protein n=1 Tax=Candidatus Pedobacter colombiensis TaxID=3121371 RepID=A0AAJ6B5U2_9SPHI|nr:hypothetical protein [Pedobacter sp.]WEK18154.1 MAG: hypothetical protein P0Y49_15285 [Pedobacter sp.]